MHLVILTLDFPPEVGGVQTYLYEVARRLNRAHQVSIVTPVKEARTPDAEMPRVIPPYANAISFWRAIHMLRPDHVLVGHAHPQLLLAAALATRGRYATMAHGDDFLAAQQHWHRPLFNWLLAQSQPLLTNSRATAKQLRQLGLPEPAVVYPGTDPTQFSPGPEATAAPPTLLTVGRLVPRKGIDTVLRALPALLGTSADLRYQIAGDGPDRPRLGQLARDLNVAHAVTFLGRVPDEVLPEVYRRASIFVMPAHEKTDTASIEGFGIVYLEASASGLPVVAGRSRGAVEAVRDGETGLLVPPNDHEVLSATLLHLLQDSALRRRLGQAGRRWVEQEMNWDRTARQIQEALQLC